MLSRVGCSLYLRAFKPPHHINAAVGEENEWMKQIKKGEKERIQIEWSCSFFVLPFNALSTGIEVQLANWVAPCISRSDPSRHIASHSIPSLGIVYHIASYSTLVLMAPAHASSHPYCQNHSRLTATDIATTRPPPTLTFERYYTDIIFTSCIGHQLDQIYEILRYETSYQRWILKKTFKEDKNLALLD